jgi:transcriptional regulator with XRE-family HTH domain
MAKPLLTLPALGRAIAAARAERDKSQSELAVDSTLHRTYISGVERGQRNVSVDALAKIAEGLGMKPSELLARAERLTEEAA